MTGSSSSESESGAFDIFCGAGLRPVTGVVAEDGAAVEDGVAVEDGAALLDVFGLGYCLASENSSLSCAISPLST